VSAADCIYRVRAAAGVTPAQEVTDQLQLLIAVATWIIEYERGPQIKTAKVYKASGDSRKRAVVLPAVNITVQSVTVDGTALAASAYTVDEEAGIVYSDSLTDGDVNIAIAYTAGSTTIAPPVRQACIELVAHLFQVANFGASENQDDEQQSLAGFALPRRVIQLINSIPVAAGIA
jgi:hypothetical protein